MERKQSFQYFQSLTRYTTQKHYHKRDVNRTADKSYLLRVNWNEYKWKSSKTKLVDAAEVNAAMRYFFPRLTSHARIYCDEFLSSREPRTF